MSLKHGVSWRSVGVVMAVALAIGMAPGCGNNSNSDGGSDLTVTVDFSVATKDAAATADLAVPQDAGTGGDAGDAGTPADLATPPDLAPNCTGDGGCYACAPTTNAQFENQCTGSSCSHFNNGSRLPLLLDGGVLPPLP